ncbi:MAG: aerobic carbon-monoxide dehydrogenase small subunit [Alphaproteobacteria bacterium]|jgi:carbon-monoxide dehydrogenase small subunit|nr:aerobic carbon-monoxide dehydrogenase small subunit [Alphaproteobacteria bacterium]
MNESRTIVVTVNGRRHEAKVPVRMTLVDFLRHQLGLTGTHVGCEHGVCGACTVLFDGRAARACLMFAVQADEHEVTTVEGIAAVNEDLHPLQAAFRDHHGLQCGFCTPGFLTTLLEFLQNNPSPTEEEARDAISGNLCRCTGYQGIVAATLDAADRLRSRKEPST